jgi:DNA ligase D-like protein (predicted 3'-phosphoesterase)
MAKRTGKQPGGTRQHGKLSEYRDKRDLAASGEPGGGKRRGRRRPRFVVQEHQARSLHYDFRLEADGTLKSWAIPKGPAADPAQKRLAMPTEDHPLEYEDFEGIIPEGEYGAGEVIVWDAGTYDNQSRDRDGHELSVAEAISRGHVSVVLHGKKLRGGYSLTKMRRRGGGSQAWLLVKKADEFAGGDRVKTRPESVRSGKTVDQLADG